MSQIFTTLNVKSQGERSLISFTSIIPNPQPSSYPAKSITPIFQANLTLPGHSLQLSTRPVPPSFVPHSFQHPSLLVSFPCFNLLVQTNFLPPLTHPSRYIYYLLFSKQQPLRAAYLPVVNHVPPRRTNNKPQTSKRLLFHKRSSPRWSETRFPSCFWRPWTSQR